MTITSEHMSHSALTMTLTGRLDTASSALVERKIKQWGEEVVELTLDFSGLTYISSMGLRVLMQTHKAMKAQDRKLIIINMRDAVREVFEMTGFLKLMVQEEKFVVVRKEEENTVTFSLNGQIETENLTTLTQELTQLRFKNKRNNTETLVVLDVEKLSYISDDDCQQLRRVINETAWEKRKIVIRHASSYLAPVFINSKLGSFLE